MERTWCEFSLRPLNYDLESDRKVIESSLVCFASPEVTQFIKSKFKRFQDDKFVETKCGKILKFVESRNAPKNSVNFATNFKAEKIEIRPFKSGILKALERVKFKIRSENLDEFVRWFESVGDEFPIREGEIFKLRTRNSEIPVLAENCEPFYRGIVDKKCTEISLEIFSNEDMLKLAKFSLNFVDLNKIKLPMKMSEISCEKIKKLLKVQNLEQKCLNYSNLVLINDPSFAFGVNFGILKNLDESKILVQILNTDQVEQNSIFFTNLFKSGKFMGNSSDWRIIPVEERNVENLENSEEVQIAFYSTNKLRNFNLNQIDEKLKKFFETEKYLLNGSSNEIESGLIFKVLKLKNSERNFGALVSSNRAKLYQKSSLRIPVPRISVRNSPEYLAEFQDRVEKSLSNAKRLIICGGNSEFYEKFCSKIGFSLFKVDCGLLIGDSSGSTEAKIRQIFASASDEIPCLFVMNSVERLILNRDGKLDSRVLEALKSELKAKSADEEHFYAVGNASKAKKRSDVDKHLVGLFGLCLEMPQSDEENRRETIKFVLEEQNLHSSVPIEELARKTAGFSLQDIKALLRKARIHLRSRLPHDYKYAKLSDEDLEKALGEIQDTMADSIGAPKIPQVKWADVGGLEDAKREILDCLQMPLKHPELLRSGMKRSGVLMYGPPGVGKTLLAKAVATECNLNFLSVKGPELLNMYVGQSEQNVREVFERAKLAKPCVIFFDELDSLAPNRGQSGDSGGVMDRVVSQLLAELDSLGPEMVFVIGATNRPDLLDQALLRPGRFDRLVYLGIADDPEEQMRILGSLTRKLKLEDSLEAVCGLLPKDLTGADLYSICSEASLAAIAEKINQIENCDTKCNEISVSLNDFETALQRFTPSVTKDDLAYYENVHKSISNQ